MHGLPMHGGKNCKHHGLHYYTFLAVTIKSKVYEIKIVVYFNRNLQTYSHDYDTFNYSLHCMNWAYTAFLAMAWGKYT